MELLHLMRFDRERRAYAYTGWTLAYSGDTLDPLADGWAKRFMIKEREEERVWIARLAQVPLAEAELVNHEDACRLHPHMAEVYNSRAARAAQSRCYVTPGDNCDAEG